MTEKRKERKSCHDCGLEAIDNCQMTKAHIPDDERLLPCKFCSRNLLRDTQLKWKIDAYSENWYRNADKTPTIEMPSPHDCTVLTLIRLVLSETEVIA